MFSPESSVQQSAPLIPSGTLVNARLLVNAVDPSSTTGADIIKYDIGIEGGEHDGKIVKGNMIFSPFDSRHSPGAIQMGTRDLTRIFEALGVFIPTDRESYQKLAVEGMNADRIAEMLDNQVVPCAIKIEPGKDGHADRNRVDEFLTPNPNSGRAFQRYQNLVHGTAPELTEARKGAFKSKRPGAYGGAPGTPAAKAAPGTAGYAAQKPAGGAPAWVTNKPATTPAVASGSVPLTNIQPTPGVPAATAPNPTHGHQFPAAPAADAVAEPAWMRLRREAAEKEAANAQPQGALPQVEDPAPQLDANGDPY